MARHDKVAAQSKDLKKEDSPNVFKLRETHHNYELKKNRTWCEPNQLYLDKTMRPYRTKDEYLPFIVGFLSILLAFLVNALDAAYGVNAARSSISHYYYAPIAGSAFVIILSFIAAFMFAYRGQSHLDGWITTIGGFGALLTAVFPTAGLGIKNGQPIDHRFVEVSTIKIDEQGRYIGGIINFDGNWFQLFLQNIFGSFSDEIVVITSSVVEYNGEMITAQVTKTYMVGNWLSQLVHQVGAAAVIGSLVVLSIVHMFRKNWSVYNIDADAYINRETHTFDWEWWLTLICVLLMVAGCLMVVSIPSAEFAEWFSRLLSKLNFASALLGNDFSDVERRVFHGELIALSAFGFAWLVQGFNYRKFMNDTGFEQIRCRSEDRKDRVCH